MVCRDSDLWSLMQILFLVSWNIDAKKNSFVANWQMKDGCGADRNDWINRRLAYVIGVVNLLTVFSKSSGGGDDEAWKKEQSDRKSVV